MQTHQKADMQRNLKLQLRRFGGQSTAAALEATWQPKGVLVQSQLTGVWQMGSPGSGSSEGLLTPDWPRLLLNMYAGRFLNMELVTKPEIVISATGEARTRTQLKWGRSKDDVLLLSSLKVVPGGRVLESRRELRSSALSLTLPLPKSERRLRVTYLDGDLMIIRDQYGAVDVLWRQPAPYSDAGDSAEGEQMVAKDLKELEREAEDAADAVAEQLEAVEVVEEEKDAAVEAERAALSEKVDQLTANIDELKAGVRQRRQQAGADRAERERLLKEVTNLERDLQAASVDVKATNVALDTIGTMNARAQEAMEGPRRSLAQRQARCDALRAEITGRGVQAVALEESVAGLKARETSLLGQIPIVKKDLNEGPRDMWPSYRTALAAAQLELKQVRRSLAQSKRKLTEARRDIGRATAALQQEVARAETFSEAERRIAEQLEAQRREYEEQEANLPSAAAAEERLRARLRAVGDEVEALELREAEGLREAEETEREMARLTEELKQTRKAARTLQRKQSRWPRLR